MYTCPRAAAWRTALRARGRPHESATRIWQRRHYAADAQLPIRKIADRTTLHKVDFGAKTLNKSGLPIIVTNPNGVLIRRHTKDYAAYFEHLAIRDMCQCERCVDPSTRQRRFVFADIPLDIRGQYHIRNGKNGRELAVSWTDDVPGFGPDHVSVFALGDVFNEANRTTRGWNHLQFYARKQWDARKLKDNLARLEFPWTKFIEDVEHRDRAVEMLLRWGLIFVQGVPADEGAVKRIMERFGPIRNTFYGETWDVRSVAGAKNVAYTARDLGFHQDLLYMENPTGLQALHMIKASRTGGESLFTDAALAVDTLMSRAPEHTRALFDFPVTYRYRNAGEWYEYSRPTLEGEPIYQDHKYHQWSPGPQKVAPTIGYGYTYNYINWSPPFQGPFMVNRGLELEPAAHKANPEIRQRSRLREYRKAAEALRQLFEAPEAVFETRMEPGTCVVFNNRRILHARKAFPVGGGGGGGGEEEGEGDAEERWLRGAYADLDPLMSRYRKSMSGEGDLTTVGRGPKRRANAANVPRSEGKSPEVEESEIASLEANG